ncbi:hypothetical protein SAMN02745824_1077 [Parasphingorhabdus marina DSM 22363]|uniref:Acid phosphatase n=1 Tax=Parasphingorhabdus marina DSM 22363 TaxID=1123272 RepID=A0A1N6CVJ3_9SPHN|nr:hypothetical protein [Parasphingorhabdus marina]SIN62486.1 hypothetical protein SAMN02745824_1077 [Parasphingorhabdus marina DSM 22363]
MKPVLHRLFLPLALLPLLSGCVAAVLPLAAAGMIGKGEIDREQARRDIVAAGARDVPAAQAATESGVLAEYSGQGGAVETGSGSSAALQLQQYLSRFQRPAGTKAVPPYLDFTSFAIGQAQKIEAGAGARSAVLQPRFALEKPEMISCAGKPLAVMIDLDDKTAPDWLEADTLYWQRGLPEALSAMRAAKISVIWLSDQPALASDRIVSILSEAGLAAPDADDFLFLDRGGDDRKQARRWDAARSYCIVAAAGDKRADFDELYDYLRNPDGAITLEHMFGAGWFLTPPPLVAAPEPDTVEDQNVKAEKEG